MIQTHWLWWPGFVFSFLTAEVFTYRSFYLVYQEISFFSSELDLYLFPCNQTTPAIHLKLGSQLSTQHQSGLGCACVFRGLNTSFHKYCSYSNACAVNNHLHQENVWSLVTSASHLNHRLNTCVLAQKVSAPEQWDRQQQILKPL